VAAESLHCTILTPERTVLTEDAHLAVLPAVDGEVGILHNRAPLLCRLGVGVVRLEGPAGVKRIFVDEGFAEVRDNQVTVVTPQALLPEEIDVAAVQAAQTAAQQRPARSEAEQEARRHDLEKAAAQLRVAGR
jgi:F-type H+-transporting ATPase subunit epsilon